MNKRAILIDSELKRIEYVEISGLEAMQNLVGGYIERAHEITTHGNWQKGTHFTEDLFVDEDGLNKGLKDFFYFKGAHQPFAGNGLIVGYENDERTPVTLDLDFVKSKVSFHDPQSAILLARELEDQNEKRL